MSEKRRTNHRRRNHAPPSIEIREMRLEDLSAVFALGQKLFTAEDLPTLYRSWDEDEVMKLFSADHETCLVAATEGRIVGFVLGGMMEKPRNAWRYGWLEWLGVAPRYKRHGIGTRLLNQLTNLFVRRNARIMLVDTTEDNQPALAFFRKLGFGREMRHVYLSQNLDTHPEAIGRKETMKEDGDE